MHHGDKPVCNAQVRLVANATYSRNLSCSDSFLVCGCPTHVSYFKSCKAICKGFCSICFALLQILLCVLCLPHVSLFTIYTNQEHNPNKALLYQSAHHICAKI